MTRRPPTWEPEYCAFFAARQRALMRTAYTILGSWQSAEDVVQNTLSIVYVHWTRIHEGSRDAYARRVLVNQCMASFRSVRNETVTDELPDRGISHDETDRLDLARALPLLGMRDRVVLTLRFLDDLPVQEVAAVLDVPTGTVKSQTSRALRRLAVLLGESAESEPEAIPSKDTR
jgi:RNA polymerase sigma-70 factor (sigma-E family)